VLLTSTANDKLVEFHVTIASINLSDAKGNSVPLYNIPSALLSNVPAGAGEFLHLNGVSQPLVTVSVPQGIYTSASVKVAGCGFTDVTLNSSGGLTESTDAQGLCSQGTGDSTVNLPSPITIGGSAMALSLNLQVPQSYTLATSPTAPPPNYTISPVFTLAAFPISTLNAKITGIDAVITSLNVAGNTFVAQTPDGNSLTIKSDSHTAYQGVPGLSTLTTGTLINLDLAVQADASLLATRIEVNNLAAVTTSIGPFVFPSAIPQEFWLLPLEYEGCNNASVTFCSDAFQYDSNTIFGISGQFSNLQTLPFPASFSGPTFFPGQNVAAFSSGVPNAQSVVTATTVTLLPQTLNGTVTAVSSSGGFSVYTVALATYDLIPTVQSNLLPANRLANPNAVTVYADANTQLLNSAPINIGSVLRFRGLIFNDNGALRMDCGQINDGVTE
jgi:hypothetical protein